ncbi:hypothetical protein GWI33_006696 [Rhynchophorus ferrugineus]|uniref:C2H2-type domain-containing protein n=1 Tax=Rhynchophorus ferrugineus TaxID=354439 RepID=A0A834MDJ4_RHYFE|nr:hypothetical protein GWI33_006696 [Rhynchophorus ferrugineus]
MSGPLKVYPTIEQCQKKNKLTCLFKECGDTFTSESNLNLHIVKTHKRMDLKSVGIERQYFCPQVGCVWSAVKHFKNMKSLRQHYLKVHTKKDFTCASCKKSFPTNDQMSKHTEYCDVMFSCLDCKAFYGCYETLKTHSRRKNHKILEKSQYKNCNTINIYVENLAPNDKNNQTIYEKPLLASKMIQVSNVGECFVPQLTQQTQTSVSSDVLSVETQTINNIKLDLVNNFKHINTQTDAVTSKETSSNTSFNLSDFDLTFANQTEKNNSSTQTSLQDHYIFNMSTNTHDSAHTDTSDLLSAETTEFDNNFYNCHMETQTDFMFDSDIFNSDYYSDMYTQTCNDILEEFSGFNDIETQTAYEESLRSVESQTLMSSLEKLPVNVIRDMAHSETQTDEEFRQMLEIINS